MEWWIVDGVLSAEGRCPARTPSSTAGWIVPGLVDAHCHIGLGAHGAGRRSTKRRAGRNRTRRRRAVAARLRIADRHPQPRRPRRPAADHPGRAAPGPAQALHAGSRSNWRTSPSCPRRWPSRRDWRRLGQARRRLDRPRVGDLAPLWSDDVLKAAIDAAHEPAPGSPRCVQRGRAARPDQRRYRLHRARHRAHRRHHRGDGRRGTALVPTLINIETSRASRARGGEVPGMRGTCARCTPVHGRVRRAVGAGVPVFAGTDAGGGIASRPHRRRGRRAARGRAPRPRRARRGELGGAGVAGPARAGLGAPADLVVYRDDPRTDPAVLCGRRWSCCAAASSRGQPD